MNQIELNKNEEKTELEECVLAHFSQIKKLKEELEIELKPMLLKIKEINKDYDSKINIFQKNLDALKDKYSEAALEIAENLKKSPMKPFGGYYSPSEIQIRENGIDIEWTIDNHMYDQYHYFSVTWQEIEEHIKNNPTHI